MNVTENIKQYVWEHATAVPGYDAHVFRKDPCGAWIVWDRYGMDDNCMVGKLTILSQPRIWKKRAFRMK